MCVAVDGYGGTSLSACRYPCYDTGYAGRKAIYEVLPVDDRLASAIRRTEEVAVDPERLGIRTLRASALELVEQGLTSYEEVLPLLNECL